MQPQPKPSSAGHHPLSARHKTGLMGRVLYKHPFLRGYGLLAPALLVMGLAVAVPFALLVTMSFWTQVGFDYDTTPTLAHYQTALEKPIYAALMARSLWIAVCATLVTVIVSYPMAYFVAFHVHRHKMIWIIIITLPFWTSYPSSRDTGPRFGGDASRKADP